ERVRPGAALGGRRARGRHAGRAAAGGSRSAGRQAGDAGGPRRDRRAPDRGDVVRVAEGRPRARRRRPGRRGALPVERRALVGAGG
ncbi:MAG: Pyruvate:Oxaloacetate transcarboxylase domain protein, partial [uncultured Blastococcus sp.]